MLEATANKLRFGAGILDGDGVATLEREARRRWASLRMLLLVISSPIVVVAA